MSLFSARIVYRTFLFLAAGLGAVVIARGDDSSRARRLFANPPREYASAPLWTWNDMLTEEQIRSTLRDLAGQKVMQAFVHPRPGLMTPYLSEDWFRLWKVALDEAERLDMNVWIYDENSYPSGFAGGLVPEAMPESRGKGLALAEVKKPPKADDEFLAVFSLADDGYENVTKKARDGQLPAEGRYLVASIRLAPEGGWFGGKWYVDLIKPGVTQKFIEITMEPYRRQFSEQFGKRLPGWFTDEPHLAPAGGLHWSDHLPELFEERWGYSLLDNLPCLIRPVGDWKRVRHNYYNLLLEQFIERWAKPCYEYCEEHGLEFTGHYWEHGWPDAGHGGDNMAMYAWHQRPAIDTLMNRYSEDVNAQFGNVRAVLELSSVANQLGRKRTLCEAYGAGGWDLRFEDMKRIGDWLYVLGVNTMDEHLSYVTIRGARKRDHPQSFSYHEPWWDAYHVMAEYFTRLSLALSEGNQVNGILLVEPTTAAWMYQGDPHLKEIGDSFQKLVTDLAKAQVEFDLGCEDIIGRHGGVEELRLADGSPGPESFAVGNRKYHTVVLPPHTENLNGRTMELIEDFARRGGRVVCCGPAPTHVDGSPSDRGDRLGRLGNWKRVAPDDLSRGLLEAKSGVFSIRQDDDEGILFHHRRKLDDGEIVFLVNTSIDSPASGVIRTATLGIEEWCLETGKISLYPFERDRDGLKARFQLPPCGSLLLFLSDKKLEPAAAKKATTARLKPIGPMGIRRMGPNVLTLDYVDVTAGGETRKNLYFYKANQFAFQQNGEEGDPWDRAVQLRDNLITKKFPADSGFEATYRFTIEKAVPKTLHIVIERPDLYTITCNEKSVAAKEGDWWLDRSFGRIDLTSVVRVGENAVTVKASPMTIYHELEPAYLLGAFAVEPAGSGFVIAPDRPIRMTRQLGHGNAIEGTMWLSSGIGYHRDPAAKEGNDRAPFVVFDLGKPCDLGAIEIWNYNEVNITARGVKKMAVTGSTTGKPDSFTTEIGTFELGQASGGEGVDAAMSETLRFEPKRVRFVKFDILSNHAGATFPADGEPAGNGFVGLSEVRFHEALAGPRPILGVRVHEVSSELTRNHNRRAEFLLDSSGLEPVGVGWNRQGHPFYAAGVAYRQKFNVEEPKGEYVVVLGSWNGSVAKVVVNGEPAGYVAYAPWECNVTDRLKPGENTIDVEVIGTLKNTLGPHHAGQLRGAAWPHMFQIGPETGPPPGSQYDTIGYGLLEPFVVEQRK